MSEVIKVGIADLNVAKAPLKLRTSGLGSCVGVTLYDATRKIAGMVHVMLPCSDISKNQEVKLEKYADTAIPLLLERMKETGANVSQLSAKLAGGAQMFTFSSNSDVMRIGPRNVEACKQQLSHYKIPILAEDTGGNFGRTIEIDASTGVLMIRTVQQGTKEV